MMKKQRLAALLLTVCVALPAAGELPHRAQPKNRIKLFPCGSRRQRNNWKLSLAHLICEEEDPYIELANRTVNDRYRAMMNALGLPVDDSEQNTKYYTLVDVKDLSRIHYGEDFAEWLVGYRTELEFLNDLASKKGVVLMYGPGFNAPEGTVRISLANLNTGDYVEIAIRLFELLDEYYEEFEAETALDQAA